MKKDGVPLTPLRSAPSTSSATRGPPTPFAQVARETLDVELQLVGVADWVVDVECVLVVEQ